MRRRRLPPEPIAVPADWSRRSALAAAALGVAAVAVGRHDPLGGWTAIGLLAAALACAGLALLLAARAAAVIWRTGNRGAARAVAGLLLALVVLAYPAVLAVEAVGLPVLSDVSTDPSAPPPFSSSPAARKARGGALHEEPSAEAREEQRRAYPSLEPTLLDLDAREAFALTMKLVAARRWQVVEASAPKGRFGTGHIDAVARSRILGLPEDVTLRLRPQAGQTRVDMRSASRLEPHDIGANADRIQRFMDDLGDAEE